MWESREAIARASQPTLNLHAHLDMIEHQVERRKKIEAADWGSKREEKSDRFINEKQRAAMRRITKHRQQQKLKTKAHEIAWILEIHFQPPNTQLRERSCSVLWFSEIIWIFLIIVLRLSWKSKKQICKIAFMICFLSYLSRVCCVYMFVGVMGGNMKKTQSRN